MRARVSLLLRPTALPRALGLVVAVSVIVVESGLVYLFKQAAPGSAFGVVFLLGVLGVSIHWRTCSPASHSNGNSPRPAQALL
jgi:hypothetical protein